MTNSNNISLKSRVQLIIHTIYYNLIRKIQQL